MNVNQLKYVYFLGIGGIGMSALARYFLKLGAKVKGYDKTETQLTKALQAEGAQIHYNEDVAAIQNPDLVIYTPAIPEDNIELEYCKAQGFQIMKRSKVLGLINSNLVSIAIAGTHGKTSVTCLLAHLFQHNNIPVNAFLGGISTNYNTNLLVNPDAKFQIVEADEFDRSFLNLSPTIGAITSVDADHLDVYADDSHLIEGYKQFAQLVKKQLFINYQVKEKIPVSNAITYSIVNSDAQYFAKDIAVSEGKYTFTLVTPQHQFKNLQLGVAGRHNVENAVLASAILLNVEPNVPNLAQALLSFKGVKRRFEKHYESDQKVYIDDYAHHPTEIAALLNSVKEMYPNQKVLGIFQPHLFSRTRDFADQFAETLGLLNHLVLLPIYPAREKPIQGINSQWLLNKVRGPKKALLDASILPQYAADSECRVILTIGAGDIDQCVEPIKNKLIEQFG